MTEPAVGASTCASGSQVCTGNIGTLMANATKKARNAQNCRWYEYTTLPSAWMSNVSAPGRVLDVVHDDDDRQQHEQAADEREQEELDRRVDAPRTAPHADDEVHRDEHGLPEHVEEEEVGGAEHADHAHLEQQQRDEEAHLAVLDVVPAGDDDDDAEQRGEEHEQRGDAVDAHAVADVQRLDPADVLGELHARQLGLEGEQHPRPRARTRRA